MLKLYRLDGRNEQAAQPVNIKLLNKKAKKKLKPNEYNDVSCHIIGMTYYLNVYTKESQWDLPKAAAQPNASTGLDEVQCAHLLVKHNKSRRASSWREDNITRTKDEAREILEGYYKKVLQIVTTHTCSIAQATNEINLLFCCFD